MICAKPIDPAILADYWAAALSEPEQDTVEVHLFECDLCGDRLREMIALTEGVRRLAREGSLRMVVSDSYLQRAADEGLRVREYDVPAGGGVQCTVTAEDDLLIGRLAATLSGARRVDLCICDERGAEQLRLPDIPFEAEAGSVLLHESIIFAKAASTQRMIARLLAIDDTGGERLLGEYTFNHIRSLPGPGVMAY